MSSKKGTHRSDGEHEIREDPSPVASTPPNSDNQNVINGDIEESVHSFVSTKIQLEQMSNYLNMPEGSLPLSILVNGLKGIFKSK